METEVSDSNAVFIYEPVESMQIHHSGNFFINVLNVYYTFFNDNNRCQHA